MLEVRIEGAGDGWFHVSSALGTILEVDGTYTGVEQGTVELVTSGVHFLQVEMATGDSSSFDLSSRVRLVPLDDPDDGRVLQIGENFAGSLDHFSDWDWYSIHMSAGDTVSISTDSINVDTVVFVDFPNSRNNQTLSDDDSGRGLFGTNSELVYRAPHSGEYFLAVTRTATESLGGYYLSVEAAREGTETVSVPPSPELVDSRFGTMLVFEDPWGYSSIQVPEAWLELQPDESQGQMYYSLDPETGSDVHIVAENVLDIGAGELSLAEYADLIESSLLIPAGAENITREIAQTARGLSTMRIEASIFNHRLIRLIHISPDDVAISVTYRFPIDLFELGAQLADYSFGTFHVN